MRNGTDLQGAEMPDEEAAALLREQGVGVLAMADDGDAYAVPISFGFAADPPRAYVDLLQFGDRSLKSEYAERTGTACLVVTETHTRHDWRSVLARGPIEPVPEDERDAMEAAMDDNAWFPNLFPPGDPMTGVMRSVIRVREMTGRRGEAGRD